MSNVQMKPSSSPEIPSDDLDHYFISVDYWAHTASGWFHVDHPGVFLDAFTDVASSRIARLEGREVDSILRDVADAVSAGQDEWISNLKDEVGARSVTLRYVAEDYKDCYENEDAQTEIREAAQNLDEAKEALKEAQEEVASYRAALESGFPSSPLYVVQEDGREYPYDAESYRDAAIQHVRRHRELNLFAGSGETVYVVHGGKERRVALEIKVSFGSTVHDDTDY